MWSFKRKPKIIPICKNCVAISDCKHETKTHGRCFLCGHPDHLHKNIDYITGEEKTLGYACWVWNSHGECDIFKRKKDV